MPYITYYRKKENIIPSAKTSYVSLEYFQVQDKEKSRLSHLEEIFDGLYEKAVKILGMNLEAQYTTYFKKKKNGHGWRRIDIPSEAIKRFMAEVDKFIKKEAQLVFNDSIYGYVPNRNSVMMAKRHTEGGYYILRFDMADFFQSCKLKYLQDIFHDVYPFCCFSKTKTDSVIKACTYRGYLPHGGPSSPTLSNIAMLPVDYFFRTESGYTRYADDIIISTEYEKSIWHISSKIEDALRGTPFKMNPSKFRININGKQEKILGLTLIKPKLVRNPDPCPTFFSEVPGRIVLGSKKKKELDGLIYTFLMNCKNGKIVTLKHALLIQGKLSYAESVEPDYIKKLISKCERKVGISFYSSLENIILSG